MMLDSGICTIFRRVDASTPGGMQKYDYVVLDKGWYGELNFETSPANPNGTREDTETNARIRILQNRAVDNHTMVVLSDVLTWAEATGPRYDVTRAYHGTDDDNGQPITDLTLTEVEA